MSVLWDLIISLSHCDMSFTLEQKHLLCQKNPESSILSPGFQTILPQILVPYGQEIDNKVYLYKSCKPDLFELDLSPWAI